MLKAIKRIFRENESLRKIAIIRVEPINFTIKNDTEKKSIISSFQKFLNSLDHPIQLLVNTSHLNLDKYMTDLELRVESNSKNSPEIMSHFQSYKEHLISTIKGTSIFDRNFYLIIPEYENSNIEIQLEVICQHLTQLNLKYSRLDDTELLSFLTSFFNDILEDSEKAGQATKENYLHCLIAPKHIRNYPDRIAVDNKECRIIYADGFPRMVEAGFLDKIITLNGIFDLSIFIEPVAIDEMMIMLNKELQKQKADLFSYELKGMINPALEIQYNDTRNVLEELQKGKEKLFFVSLYINCKATSLNELEMITKKVESELNSMMIIPRRANFRMLNGLKSATPFGDNRLAIKRNITTKALSAFFPFTSQFLQLDDTGVWLGINKNQVPLIKDLFKLSNPNGIVLASSGAGKSYWTKLFIIRQLLNGTKVMVIDPQAEYIKLIEKFNGQVINFSRTSKTVINPLDLMGHEYSEKRLALFDLIPVMIGCISEIQKSVLDRAITKTYERKGITDEPKTWANRPPILSDLIEELERMSKLASITEKETYRSLTNRLRMYVDGVFSFFNRQTRLDFGNNLVGFIIGDMPKQAKPVNMFLILDYIFMKMRKDLERKLLVIDEAWSLLSRAEESEYIFQIVKTSRKFNLGLLLITQDVADLLQSKASSAILQNSAYKLLMKQQAAVIGTVESTFNLSQTEKEKLLSASVGEGILILENEHTEIKSLASAAEHKLITTKPDELLTFTEPRKPAVPEANQECRPEVNITLDETKGFFRKSDLDENEISFLLANKYILSSHVPLGGGRRENYLLKPSKRESPVHYFLVKAIEEYIQNFTDKIKLAESVEPDIVFHARQRKIAIEVEAGLFNDKNKKKLINKAKLRNRKHGTDWFFVIANAPEAYKYEGLGRVFTRVNVCREIRSYFRK